MTRLLTCGWETGDLNEGGYSNNTVGTSTLTVVGSVPTPRSGNYCMKAATAVSSFQGANKTFNLAVPKTEIWVRFAVFFHPAGITGTEMVFAAVHNSSPNPQNDLTWEVGSNLIRARLGTGIGTLLATGSTPMTPEAWHVIDWRNQMVSISVGTVEVWLDGNRIINFTGDTTASTTPADMQFVQVGHIAPTAVTATGAYVAIDDVAINDVSGTINNGRIGDSRIVLMTPNGAGSSTQLARGGTDTGANYSQVNELPASAAQYVASSTVGQRDLYTLTDIPGTATAVNVVEAVVVGQNTDAGGGFVAPTIKSGATIGEATAIGLSTGPTSASARWETDPATGVAWTLAAINALEGGITVR